MKILHISLGLPPWRSGGLTQYSVDLMEAQCLLGHSVSLLYPGRIKGGKIKIIADKDFGDIKVFEIVNPLPVSLIYGISEPKSFIKKGDVKPFEIFLAENQFDIVHVHTIMGIHKELFQSAKIINVKVIFTTHDYFGICLTANLLKTDGNVCEDPRAQECALCCRSGMSLKRSKIMQSKIYRFVKNMPFMKGVKRRAKAEIQKDSEIYVPCKEYDELLLYYREILSLIDYYHFNSNLTKEIYQKHIAAKGEVLAITMADISDSRLKFNRIKEENKLRIGYIGTKKAYKGYEWIKYCIKQDNPCFEYHLFGSDFEKGDTYSNVICHGAYNHDTIEKVFSYMDVLVIPSICYETFGLVGLESISFGIPVIVSDRVGIKDIVENVDKKCIVGDEEQLYDELLKINNDEEYMRLTNSFKKAKMDFDIKSHAHEVIKIYYNIMQGESL